MLMVCYALRVIFAQEEDLMQVAFIQGFLTKTLKGFVLLFVLYGKGFKPPQKMARLSAPGSPTEA